MQDVTPQKQTHAVVIRLSALGDVTLMTGVLKYWHETYGLTFTVITQPLYTCLFDHHPAVTKAIGFERRTSFLQLLQNIFVLRKQFNGYTLIDLHGSLRSRLLGLFWQGTVKRFTKHALARRLFVHSRKACHAKKFADANITQRYALTIEKNGSDAPAREQLCPCIVLTHEEQDWAKQQVRPLHDTTTLLIALHPYATHAAKAWPLVHWQALVERLNAQGLPYILVGQGSPLANIPSKNDFTNKTDLRKLCALLKASTVLVTGDSGPMHLADAVNTPVIALFGPTTKDWGFFPVRKHHIILEHDLPCRPCSLHGQSTCKQDYACLTNTTPDHVMQALMHVLK